MTAIPAPVGGGTSCRPSPKTVVPSMAESQAQIAATQIIASLPSKTYDQLGSWLTSELGTYDLEAVRELGKYAI